MEREPFVGTLSVRRRNPFVYALGLLPTAFVALTLLAPHAPASSGPLFACGVALSLAFTVMLHARNPWPRIRAMAVRADRTALNLEDETIPTAAIANAFVVPDSDGATLVRVERPLRSPTNILVRDADEGRWLLRALGFDASQRVATFRGASQLFASWWTGTVIMIGGFLTTFFATTLASSISPPFGAVVFLAAIAGMLALAFTPARIDVGADGIVVTWLGRRRFIPLGEIDRVVPYIDGFGNSRVTGVELTLKSSEVVKLPIAQVRWNGDRLSIVMERIREAVDTHAHGRQDDAAALLGRNEQSLAAWIRMLRAIGSGANATLREAPVDPLRLWRVLESPRARLEDRAAAAVALSTTDDPEGRARLRVVAEGIADPRLRVAVDAVANEDDEALESALGDISPARGRAT